MVEDHSQPANETDEFSTFYLGNSIFGINILDIQEINKHFQITKIPQTSDYIKGVLNLRGEIVTIVDLGKKLGLPGSDNTPKNRNIIVQSQGERIGLVVDSISDVVVAQTQDIETVPSNINGIKGKYFRGILKTDHRLIAIIDTDRILSEH